MPKRVLQYQSSIAEHLFLFLLVINTLCHQNKALAQSHPFISSYNTEEGLSQSTVYDIIQDQNGYIWAATGEGLNQFDGQYFKHFYKEINKPHALNTAVVREILEDSSGGFWIGTDKSLYYKKPNLNHFKQIDTYGKVGRQICIPKYLKGNSLFGYFQDYAVFKYDLVSHKMQLFKFPVTIGLNKFISDQQGNLWANSYDGRLILFNCEKLTYTHYNFPKPISAICLDAKSKLYAANEDGIYSLYESKNKLRYRLLSQFKLPNDQIKIFLVKGNDIWIHAKKGGMYRYFIREKKLEPIDYYSEKSGFFLLVNKITSDNSGNIWIATDVNGIVKLSPERIKFGLFQTEINGKKAVDFIKCFAEDKTGNIYAGTHSEGILKYNNNLSRYVRILLPEKIQPTVTGIFCDASNTCWIATSNGIYLLDNKSKIKHLVDSVYYTGLQILNKELCFIGINHIDVIQNEQLKRVTKYKTKSRIRKLFKINQDAFFTAYHVYGAGFSYLVNHQLQSTSLRAYENLRVFQVLKLKNGGYYIASDAGILEVDSQFKILRSITEQNGLPNNCIYSLLADNAGNLWGSSNNGLFKWQKSNGIISNFGTGDGLQSREFNSYSSFIDHSGRIYFGGINGFNVFHPDRLPINQHLAPVYISELHVNQKSHILPDKNKTLQLSGNQNALAFIFSIPEFTDPLKNQLWIKVKGLSDEWKPLRNRRIFRLESLKPGKYALWAKTSNNDYLKSSPVLLLSFHIATPFFEKTEVIAGMILLIISILVWAAIFFTKRKQSNKIKEFQKAQEIEMVRKNIYRDLHDEIGAGLSRIKILTDLAILDKKSEDKGKMILQVKDTVSEVTGKLREIVWSMNPGNEKLQSVILRLQTIAEDCFNYTAIKYEITLPSEIPDIYLQPEKIRNLIMVFREALNNIQKYSETEKTIIHIKLGKHTLYLNIEDFGKGFNPDEMKQRGNGLRIMHERMQEINGKFQIISSSHSGTRIFMELPLISHTKMRGS